MRQTVFANGGRYHIFNRGVDKREIFPDSTYYERFLLSMQLLNDERNGLIQEWRDIRRSKPYSKLSDFPELDSGKNPLVEFNVYCLNPNHYHFILKQIRDNGIRIFMHKLGTSYTNYFNARNERSGALFQGKFKAICIDSNEYLIYLSAYVNKNNFIHGYNEDDTWPYCSLPAYIKNKEDKLINKDIVLDQFDNVSHYKEFLENNALHLQNKKDLARYLIEE